MIWDAIKKQIEDTYGKPVSHVEAAIENAGMEVVRFGAGKSGDTFLDCFSLRAENWGSSGAVADRLILRPKPRRRILLTETGEYRAARPGEWWVYNDTNRTRSPHQSESGSDGIFVHIYTACELKAGETV